MMLYKNTKVKVILPDGDTDFFDIVAGVLQEDTLAPIPVHNLSRLRTSNVDKFIERKWLYTGKARTRRYPSRIITNADYTDDIAFLENTPEKWPIERVPFLRI